MIEIVKYLYVGTLKDAESAEENGIDIVINLSETCLQNQSFRVIYINIPTIDHHQFPIYKIFDYCYCIIDKAIKNKQKILINCKMALSRSISIIAMYLMRAYGMSCQKALTFISEHKEIDVNHGFIKQLEKYGRQ